MALTVLLTTVIMAGYIGREEVRQFQRLRYFQITKLLVEGNLRVPKEAIIHSLGLPTHASILEIDLKDLARRIMRNPWIKTASVSRRLPLSLVIRVSERAPRTIVLGDRAYLVSEDGMILKEPGLEEMSGLPIVRVGVDRHLKVGERVEASPLVRAGRLWQQFQAGAIGPGVQPREIRLEGDGSFTAILDSGMPYLRLHEEGSRRRLERLARVLQIRGIGLSTLEYADLRFADRVIVKPLPKGKEA